MFYNTLNPQLFCLLCLHITGETLGSEIFIFHFELAVPSIL